MPTATSARSTLLAWRAAGRTQIHEADSKELLGLAGLPLPGREPSALNVVKYCCDAGMHKSELGLVELNVPGAQVAAASARLLGRAQAAGLQGGTVLVEEMVTGALLEWFVGCRTDASFGPVIALGAGGIYAELFGDAVIRMSPLDAAQAESAIRRHKAFPVIDGARGKPRADVAQFARLVAAVSQFHWEHRELVAEIDLNPVIVTPGRIVIADASVVLRS